MHASKLLGQGLEKGLDRGFVALEEVPLADLAAADQTRALQGGQVRRDGRLRQPAALVDLPGAHAMLGTVVLVGKLHGRIFEPGENVAAYRVGQGFDDVVEIEGHGNGLVSALLNIGM